MTLANGEPEFGFDLRPTTDRWVARACADLGTVLVDQAHCEKKAAATALGIVFRAPERAELCAAMSRLAREELLHFERLLGLLREREIPFGRLRPSEYAGRLVAHVRGARGAGGRPPLPQLADELLVAALIEARSTERFERLRGAPIGASLRALFAELGEAEARHGSVYVEQACAMAPTAAVARRLRDLCAFEGTILESPEEPLRLHAG